MINGSIVRCYKYPIYLNVRTCFKAVTYATTLYVGVQGSVYSGRPWFLISSCSTTDLFLGVSLLSLAYVVCIFQCPELVVCISQMIAIKVMKHLADMGKIMPILFTDASKQYARILLLDFSKAFDLINHDILLQKLASFGLPNILMKWIASFLTERTQQVKLCNTQSDWNYIHGGVPQGTKLGPVLFVLMINDLQTKCDSYKYVDDTCIVYTGSDSQAPNLQEADRCGISVDNPKRHENQQK